MNAPAEHHSNEWFSRACGVQTDHSTESWAMPSCTITSVAPFHLSAGALKPLPEMLRTMLRRTVERMLALPSLNEVYAAIRSKPAGGSFCDRALRALSMTFQVDESDLRRIPDSGPLIVVANHPFGGLDGLILTALLQRVRPDVRLLTNHLLRCVPELHETCFFVNPFGGAEAAVRNRAATRAAIRWVCGGGVLGVFPAGEVSHRTLRRRWVTDPPWNPSIGRLVKLTQAAVLPVHFDGQNGRLFQLVGLLHPRLRTMMLPHELLRRRGQSVRVQIGRVIPPRRLARFVGARGDGVADSAEASKQVAEYLRLRTYILKGRSAPGDPAKGEGRSPGPRSRACPVIEPLPSDQVASEVASLPAHHCLVGGETLRVYYGGARQLPAVLREIGRLRESTFRLVGEGTGREIDLDRFDQHYLHLFVWNAPQRRIVGAYRLGMTDELLKRFGAAGLYTTTLFEFRPRLLHQLGSALELGRSFVVPECQRDYAPLQLLWKGIGRFVALHPRYRRLFGAVSISDDYQSLTKQLLMAFLKVHRFDHDRAGLVRPRKPPNVRPFRDADQRRLATLITDLADVEELVGDIESDRRAIPVLLRQYLKLNAKLLGFNIDPEFGDVLDGLVLVDLTTVGRAILNRYLGKDGAAAFLAYHAIESDPPRPR